MQTSPQVDLIAAALVKAQAEFEPVAMNATGQVGTRHYKYADLAAIIAATRPTLAKHGLAVTQTTEPPSDENPAAFETTLWHESGQWFRSRLELDLRHQTPQDCGKVITYYRRYAWSAMLGISTEEDTDAAETDHVNANGQGRRQPDNREHRRQEPRNRRDGQQNTQAQADEPPPGVPNIPANAGPQQLEQIYRRLRDDFVSWGNRRWIRKFKAAGKAPPRDHPTVIDRFRLQAHWCKWAYEVGHLETMVDKPGTEQAARALVPVFFANIDQFLGEAYGYIVEERPEQIRDEIATKKRRASEKAQANGHTADATLRN